MKKSDYYLRIYELCDGFKHQMESGGKCEIKKRRGRPCKSNKTKVIRKRDEQKSFSGKHTSAEESVKIE